MQFLYNTQLSGTVRWHKSVFIAANKEDKAVICCREQANKYSNPHSWMASDVYC